MDIICKSATLPGYSLLFTDWSVDRTEELVEAIEQAKKEWPEVNLDNCYIDYIPAKLVITKYND